MKDLKKHILHSLAVCCVAPPQVSQGHQPQQRCASGPGPQFPP
jgi:hypothetical protein